MELIIKYRPNYLATFVVEHMLRKHTDEIKLVWTSKTMQELTNRTHCGSSPSDYAIRNHTLSSSINIQEDLDNYLSDFGVQLFFSDLVEKLLSSEASNPFMAIVEYLGEKFPEQTILALEINQPRNNARTSMLAKNTASIMKQNDSDAESDDDDDGLSDLPDSQSASDAARYNRRRVSVSSESIDPEKLKQQIAHIIIIPKDPEVAQHLYQVVSRSTMLRRMLDSEERALIVKAFQGPVIKHAGENIIIQGEEGNLFYIIDKGQVDVYVRKSVEAEEEKVHTYHDGDTFGQLALMYNAPRAATCRAVGDVTLWTLDRHAFKVIIAGAALRKREKFMSFLQRVPILQSLNEYELMTLADSMTEEKFDSGMIICREGDPGDEFYIVSDGTAECYQRSEGGEKLVAILSPGQYFGEIALMTSKPRQTTVKSQGTLKLLIMDRSTFVRVLGPIHDILKRNMENYKKFTSMST
jgi:cAMP-dependent protein kinase regulator